MAEAAEPAWADLLADLRLENPGAATETAWGALRRRISDMVRSGPQGGKEDIVQAVALKLVASCSARDALRQASSPAAFLATMIHRVTVDLLRRQGAKSKEQTGIDEEQVDSALAVRAPDLDSVGEYELLQAQLETLAPAERQLLHLGYWERLSVRAIAALLGEGESAVRMRIFRALKKLRPGLTEDPE
ncbi:MAG TPA: sigma-70 family RNA polymerase sigma factor [Gemmataceae bacterium]|jgi:RNA polymerase sigma factor (sigma-70 family)|nr:sigma-70 family RNA polymerase sigma factor [Gemmataceae bacterium]